MKLFLSVVMFCLFMNNFATAQTLIQDSCKKAAAKDPQFKYDFCVNSLQQDPTSKSATSLEGLVLASTKNAATKTTTLQGRVTQILNDPKHDKRIDEALRTCIQLFDSASDSLHDALSSIQSKDYRSANVKISSALDSPTTCEDSFNETKRLKSPITIEDNALFQKILIPLAFTNML